MNFDDGTEEKCPIPIINCTQCFKKHKANEIFYCHQHDACFIIDHKSCKDIIYSFCSIDNKYIADTEYHCLYCNKCHNLKDINYCDNCNKCEEYEHISCLLCSRCIEDDIGSDNDICNDCILKMSDKSLYYTCCNCYELHSNKDKYNYCIDCHACYKHPKKCKIKHNNILCILCKNTHQTPTTFCSKCNQCYKNLNNCPHSKEYKKLQD